MNPTTRTVIEQQIQQFDNDISKLKSDQRMQEARLTSTNDELARVQAMRAELLRDLDDDTYTVVNNITVKHNHPDGLHCQHC